LRSSKPSGRLQKKIDVTYNYFLEQVDPIIGDCITYLLCEQPKNVPMSMLKYLKKKAQTQRAMDENNGGGIREDDGAIGVEASVVQAETEEDEEEDGGKNSRPKKEQKLYLAMSIGPVVAKLVNRVAITRPKRVVDFLCRELSVMIYGSTENSGVENAGSNIDEVDDRFAVYGTFAPEKKPKEPSLPPTELETPGISEYPVESVQVESAGSEVPEVDSA
jgi:hypothetical protein